MLKRVISVGLFALTAGTLWSLNRQMLRSRPRQDRRLPAPVQTWEGEGGALPATGSQLGPDPVVPASNAAIKEDQPGVTH